MKSIQSRLLHFCAKGVSLEKSRLSKTRIDKGLSQKEIAEKMHMDVSTYCRKESGQIKIRKDEWIKLANILEVSLEDIYENDESHIFVFKDNSTGNYLGTNHIYSIPESLLETQRKYIALLESEIEKLKSKS